MRILSRYITKNVISGYLFILFVFIGLYFVIDIFTTLSDILKTKPPLMIVVNYYLYMLPLIFLRVAPFSLLISTLYTFGELNKNNEIISMRASGISIIKICFPVIFFALLASFVTLYVQEKTLAPSQKKVEDIKLRYIKNDKSSIGEEKNFAFPSKNTIFFARKFIPKEGILEDVTMFDEDKNGNITKKSIAKKLSYSDGTWEGSDIIEYSLDSKGNIVGKPSHWLKREMPLEDSPHEIIAKQNVFSQFASLKNLKKEITRLKRIGASSLLNNLVIDYHRKIADAFSHLFLIICILPFALEIKKRKVALSSLGTGFIFGFIYYLFTSFSIALGKSSVILPIFSAWLAPLFFLTVGITGLFLVK
ncbi:MAG: YjgP/YjgQ family permease [Candidatus Omnitrophica bacterium]|nr:YjgP/YjgQ family permease [Candidatus Omnitrophota bacterium]